jgi:hypothetical protein
MSTPWLGNRVPVLAHSLQVKLDRLLDVPFHFFARVSGGNTAGQIRNVGAIVTPRYFFDHDGVFHCSRAAQRDGRKYQSTSIPCPATPPGSSYAPCDKGLMLKCGCHK